jgi:CheY-like chemotaxis protein
MGGEMIQISKILKQVSIFRMLGKESIDFIVERLKFKTYEADEIICKTGDPGDTMFIIINGGVKICIYGTDNEERVVATLGPGDYFGEMALLTGEPRSATVVTTDSSEMFLLHKNDFDVILEKFPSISLSMGKIVSKRLRETLSKAISPSKEKMIMDTGPKGSLQEKGLVDLVHFCEGNSLTGTLMIKNNGQEGIFSYRNGELLSVTLGALTDDKALDEMLTWTNGTFEIKSKPLTLEEKQKSAKDLKETRKILIVSQSLVVRKLIERAFKGLGYTVSNAENIIQSENTIKKELPDIIISDIKLADGSGLDFCKKVKAGNDIPFIFLKDDSIKPEFEQELQKIGRAELTKTHEVSEIVKIVENMI